MSGKESLFIWNDEEGEHTVVLEAGTPLHIACEATKTVQQAFVALGCELNRIQAEHDAAGKFFEQIGAAVNKIKAAYILHPNDREPLESAIGRALVLLDMGEEGPTP